MPFERAVYVPDFNLRVNTFFMPDTILDNPGIDEFTQNAPNTIKAEVNNVLEAYYKKPRSFLKNLMDSSVFKDIGNGLYASLKDNNTHLIHLNIPDMKPIEVYEVNLHTIFIFTRKEGKKERKRVKEIKDQ